VTTDRPVVALGVDEVKEAGRRIGGLFLQILTSEFVHTLCCRRIHISHCHRNDFSMYCDAGANKSGISYTHRSKINCIDI
jgi:hypothetical protein